MQRYSKLFGKTTKEAPKDATLVSHKLLVQAGFIKESSAGRYFFLPLGMRVRDKIVNIIEKEMNSVGGQKMITPVLHPIDLWKETNRTNTTGFELMRIQDRRGAEFVLGGTAEEMFVDVVRKFKLSYKDLPINLYQFSDKFRDEMRARGGLLRVREFLMKDAYTFDRNEEEFKKNYKLMWDCYTRIFTSLGLNTKAVLSDNGYIGGEYCHEFIVDSEAGESRYLESEDGNYIAHEDVAEFLRENINEDEEIKPLEVINQPEWVKTIEDNQKHYNLPASRFLKNVVYKNRVTNDIIIAVIRGDLEVNKTKLEHVLDAVEQLEEASVEDLASFGSKPGWVHSWGHTGVRYIGDISLKTVRNFIGGQKEANTDTINVNYGRDFECEIIADIALAKAGYMTIDGKSRLIEKKGVEVGNIFQLGYHYSTKMKDSTFIDQDGKEKPYYMGCYGIGVGRTLATVVEIHHDEKGIIWPESIAPYDIHLITLNEKYDSQALDFIERLESNGKSVLWDDRIDASAGEKFADADLLGIPLRLVISDRSMQNGGIEVKRRNSNKSENISIEKFFELYL